MNTIQVILAGELNAYDILVNDWIVFTKATLPGAKATAAAEGSASDEAQSQAAAAAAEGSASDEAQSRAASEAQSETVDTEDN